MKALCALAAAFWKAYAPRKSCDGAACAPIAVRRNRIWLWAATAAIAALLTFPYYVPWLM
ncbi:hypothetical protein GCM10027188_21910 [Lysobacter humi (ex Lee et al. 2017)]